MNALQARGIEIVEILTDSQTPDPERLSGSVEELSACVFIGPPEGDDLMWIGFLAGISLARALSCRVFTGGDTGAASEKRFEGAIPIGSTCDIVQLTNEIHASAEAVVKRRRCEKARKTLVESGHSLTNAAFADVIASGDRESVLLFLESGLSPDNRDSSGTPFLNIAVRNHRYDLCLLLLEKGCSVNVQSSDRGNTPLMEAAGRGMSELVTRLVTEGADLEIQNHNGQTALILAVAEGFVQTAEFLLDSGARIECTDALGMTAYKYASLYGHTSIIERIERTHTIDS